MSKPSAIQIYMDVFFGGKDPERLKEVFRDDLLFEGPFYTFQSASDYIESLKKDPPVGVDYEIIRRYEDDDSVTLLYRFRKGKIDTPMTQTFFFEGDRIARILLVFDGRVFE